MPPLFGIDTSILVRLLVADPEVGFRQTVDRLTELARLHNARVVASNQVIGEAYVTVQHHYGVEKADARDGLIAALTSGLVAPLNGDAVLDALRSRTGCGLVDRLIAEDYGRDNVTTLTLDRKMARLPNARLL